MFKLILAMIPWMWPEYDEYDNVAVTQKVDRFMIRGGIGFFVTF